MLVLSSADVEQLLDLDALVDTLEVAMRDLSAGRASVPPRVAARVEARDAMLLAMPAYSPSAGSLAAKLVTQFPHNTGRPSHQAMVCCFDPDDGAPLAVLDGEYLTSARTAAGSVLATRLLARPDARTVAVIGTGTQARAHVRAFARSGVGTVLIAGRDPARAERAAEELRDTGVEPAPSIEQAVRAADIVCACTHTDRPVVHRAWLRPGAHVNSVGYNAAGTGEVDLATITAALVAVESRGAALAPAPAGAIELLTAAGSGALDPSDVVEIGELADDPSRGRTDDTQLTLYKSVGVGVQDSAAAALVLRSAAAQGRGTTVEF